MNAQYKQALELVKSGALVKRTGYDPDLEIFCYTQDTFWNTDWNDITLTHRGKLYYKGTPVNFPFPKIFNLNEHESTKEDVIFEKMKTCPYEVLHKSNGHLLIASVFKDDCGDVRIVYSTKGSLPHESNPLLNKDIEILKEQCFDEKLYAIYRRSLKPFTLMFEAIVEHDPHTLYAQDVQRYGGKKNTFVLLGWYNEDHYPVSAKHSCLWHLANDYGFDVVEKYDHMADDVHSWFNHKDTEGYVIKFNDESDLRVKIKTKDYWMMRSRKDLKPENIVGAFKTAGFDRLHKNLPEEVATKICEIVERFFQTWVQDEWTRPSIDAWENYLTEESKLRHDVTPKQFMTDDTISQGTKELLLTYYKGVQFSEYVLRCSKSREKRQMFYDWFINRDDEIEYFAFQVEQIFEHYGETR